MASESASPEYEIWAGECEGGGLHSWNEVMRFGDPIPIKAVCAACGRQGVVIALGDDSLSERESERE